jgi:amino acid adenylation domain-containing protein
MQNKLATKRIPPPDSFVPFEIGQTDQSIPRRFRSVVSAHANEVAVRFKRKSTTYDKLDRRSNRIANAILALTGTGSQPVALLLPPSAAFVAAKLSVLKAGKISVPIDPVALPAEIREFLRHSETTCVLHDDQNSNIVAELRERGIRTVNIDRLDGEFPDDDPLTPVSPETPAYIYYTSGTTGEPKGVYDCHRNVLHNVTRYTNSLCISPGDRLTMLQSPTFSGTVSSIFGALLNGACLCINEFRSTSPTNLATWLRDEQITIYHSVPSIFRSIVRTGGPFPSIRVVRLEGDRATRLDAELFKQHFAAPCHLVNGLGITETGLVRQHLVSHETEISESFLPVGLPVQDMEVQVVDNNHQSVPDGCAGQIAVRSRYLACGYWRDEERTESAFLADSDDPHSRIYLTGDLGRLTEQGVLQHLGRKTGQARLRGHTIDLTDVESFVMEMHCVSDAVATIQGGDTDSERIVVYYVPTDTPPPTTSEFRRILASRLTAPAVPSVFVPIDALPLSPSGKIDRERLPTPSKKRPELDEAYVPAASVLQLQIVQIWEDLLQVDGIGINDNFFDVGGTSLMAINMLVELDKAIGVDLDPTVMLANPTVRLLADLIQTGDGQLREPIVELNKGDGGTPLFFLHGDYISGGFYCLRLAKLMDQQIPLYSVSPRDPDDDTFSADYHQMALRHLDAIKSVQKHGPYYLAGTCNGGMIAYEIARILESQGEPVGLLALFVASASNVRFRSLERFVTRLGSWMGHRPEQRSALFLRLRTMVMNLKSNSLPRKAWYALRKMYRLPREIAHLLRPERNALGPSSELTDTWKIYQAIDARYIPGPYSGAVTLIWPTGETETADKAASYWRQVAGEVEIVSLASTHHDCLTKDADLLGAALSEAYTRATTSTEQDQTQAEISAPLSPTAPPRPSAE